MKFLRKPVYVNAVLFDIFEHKIDLPKGVQGIPSPGADNWAYSGCSFFLQGTTTPVYWGDWVVTDEFGKIDIIDGQTFLKLYEPA